MVKRRLFLSCIIPTAFLFSSVPSHGARGSESPQERPSVKSILQNPEEDQDWTPLLFRKEHQPMPAVREMFEGIKQGGHENFERAIRTAYRLVEAYGHNEGHKISIVLNDFKTLHVPEVLGLKLSDISSIGLADHILVSGVTREDVRTSGAKTWKKTSLGYRLKWEPTPPDPDHELWTKRSVRDYVEIAKADTPALALLRSVTTYRVSVTLDGAHHDYRAAFLWMGAVAGPAIATFQCIDPVIDRMSLVLTEQVPPEGKEEGSLLDSRTEPSAGGEARGS
jgi:hypothetical protein